jgi:hypothetical protein
MYGGEIIFDEILKNFLQLSGKEDEYYKAEKVKKKVKDRKFEELTSTKALKDYCIDKKKGCAIAFLPAHQIVSPPLYNSPLKYLSVFPIYRQAMNNRISKSTSGL